MIVFALRVSTTKLDMLIYDSYVCVFKQLAKKAKSFTSLVALGAGAYLRFLYC